MSSRLISFFKKSTQKDPDFTMNIDHDGVEGLSVQSQKDTTLLKFTNKGKIGVYTNEPRFDLDVNGVVGIKSKVGTHLMGALPGDGNWHTIVSELDGLNGFEITAHIRGKLGSGRYSLAHAIALSTFGGKSSRSKINATVANYGSFLNKIYFRWKGTMHNYELQIRTRRHYGIDTSTGEPYPIKFNVIKLYTE